MNYYYQNRRDYPGDYFPVPKAIFRMGLNPGEIAVLAYLMYCEDRRTYQCHPSYATIGSACNMSVNTVRKHVHGLVLKGFIYKEPTTITTQDGRKRNVAIYAKTDARSRRRVQTRTITKSTVAYEFIKSNKKIWRYTF